MNKKQMDSNKVTKNFSKKVAPLVMSTSMVAAAFLAAGAPTSAEELDKKGLSPEVEQKLQQMGVSSKAIEKAKNAKNHGQKVSAIAKATAGSPEHGQIVSMVAQDTVVPTDDDLDDTNQSDDNIDETIEEVTEETDAPAEEDAE
ncbi:hypothetical protein D1B33_17980, partial [Lysinibacillus yapensis]